MTPEQHAEWLAAYGDELAAAAGDDEGMVLRRAGERTAHLWGIRIAPDGTVVINLAAMDEPGRSEMAALHVDREPEAE